MWKPSRGTRVLLIVVAMCACLGYFARRMQMGNIDLGDTLEASRRARERHREREREARVTLVWVVETVMVPLSVVILTAILTGLVVPGITREWQDHQKAIDTRAHIVSLMSESVTTFLVSIQRGEVRTSYDLDDPYQEWEINSGIIQSQLEAYFPETQIRREWDAYSGAVDDLYGMINCVGPHHAGYVWALRKYLVERDKLPGSWNGWRILRYECSRPIDLSSPYGVAWWTARTKLSRAMDSITSDVLRS